MARHLTATFHSPTLADDTSPLHRWGLAFLLLSTCHEDWCNDPHDPTFSPRPMSTVDLTYIATTLWPQDVTPAIRRWESLLTPAVRRSYAMPVIPK